MACEEKAETDTKAPVVAITSPADSTTFSQQEDVYVKASVTDESGLETVSLIVTPPEGDPLVFNEDKNNFTNNDKEALIDRTLSLSLLGALTPGEYLLTVKATDVFENVSNESITIYISESDSEAPAISISKPTEGATFRIGEDLLFEAVATDNSGISEFNLQLTSTSGYGAVYSENFSDKRTETNISESFSLGGEMEPGTYTFSVEAIDIYGNTTTKELSVEVREADVNAPTISILNPTEGMEFDTDDIMSIEIKANDNFALADALVQLELPNGQVEELLTKSYTDQRTETDIRLTYHFSTESPIGEYALIALVTDAEGNAVEERVKIQLLAADAEAPSITLHSPAAGSTYTPGQTVEVSASIADNIGIASSKLILTLPDGQTKEVYSESFTDQPTETDIVENIVLATDAATGTYTLTIVATDLQDHSRDKSIQFQVQEVDKTAPSTNISSPGEGTEVYLDNSLSLEAEATDETMLEEVTVWLQGTSGEPQLLHTESPESYLNNGKMAELSEEISLEGFTAGSYTLIVRATDKGGNSHESTVQLSLLEPDTEAPVITIYSPEEGSAHALGSEVYIDVLVTDNQQLAEVRIEVSVSVAGSQQSVYDETHTEFEDPSRQAIQDTRTIPSDAPVGTYLVTITAIDTAGNEEVKESTFEVTAE